MARLLLVDDEPVLLSAMVRLLRDVGYEVVAVPSGAQAISTMSSPGSALPDLIVTDVLMDDIDGLQLFTIVRQNPAWQDIPFIFMSASTKPELEKLIEGSTRAIFIRKPFEVDMLLRQISQALQGVT